MIRRYQKLVKDTVIPYQYRVLKDEANNVEKSHVIQNYINAGKVLRGEDAGDGFYGMVFQDSDAAKWIEAVAYALKLFPDKALEQEADALIDIIGDAQDEDGYLNTYFTIKDQDKRWANLLEGHELYCSGHMMEAACAYYETTGKDKLLKIMQKNAEHIYNHFIVEKHEGYPGHPEVELALMRMYYLTGDEKCKKLAEHFVDVRGVDADYFEKECQKRDWTVWGSDGKDREYNQSFKPVREQDVAVGHAVRAVYLYTAMADLAKVNEDTELWEACKRLWDSITQKRMYITGGIGSTVLGEAFTTDYDLPNDTAYCETCASIGLMFFASKMLAYEADSKYADVMERAFYNTVLAGMQLDGKRFFYVNPLEVVPGISGVAQTHKHDLTQRPGWHACACCPPNVARLITSIEKYAYSSIENTAYIHMYLPGEATFDNGIKISCTTKYPYDFNVNYEVLAGSGSIAVRIPDWSKNATITKNGKVVQCTVDCGYAYIEVATGDEIDCKFDSTPYFVYASTKVPKLSGQVAVCRGPLVYCFEGVDNDRDVLSLQIDTADEIKVLDYEESTLNGIVPIEVGAYRCEDEDDLLYHTKAPSYKKCTARAIPYYAWGNRGENQMRVWLIGRK